MCISFIFSYDLLICLFIRRIFESPSTADPAEAEDTDSLPVAATVDSIKRQLFPPSPLPFKKRKFVDPTNAPVHVPDAVPDAVLDAVLAPQGDPLPHPQVVVVEQEAAQDVQQVQFQDGEYDGVIFLGPLGCKHWDHRQLTTTFWVSPQMGQVVMLRSLVDIRVVDVFTHIKSYMERKSDEIMVNPIITFKGEEVMATDRLSKHSTNDTLLIFDGVVPEEFLDHAGKLYQCRQCGRAVTAKKNMEGGKKCKKGRPHKILFSELLDKERIKNWGSNLDRYSKCYGCPPGHSSTGAATKQKEEKDHQPAAKVCISFIFSYDLLICLFIRMSSPSPSLSPSLISPSLSSPSLSSPSLGSSLQVLQGLQGLQGVRGDSDKKWSST